MRLVVDTSVLLAAVMADGLCRDLVRRRVIGHELTTSKFLLDELAEKIWTKLDQNPATLPLVIACTKRARHVTPRPLPSRLCRDKDDDWVLATAAAGNADVIVTGDKDLLALKKYGATKILSPRGFLEILDAP